jgi:hypothetical protein
MDRFRNPTPSLALSIGLILSAKGAAAHGGHNMEKIVDGEAMSVDPIVGGLAPYDRMEALTRGRIRYYGFTFC